MYSPQKSWSLCFVRFGAFKKYLQKYLYVVYFCCVFISFRTFTAIWIEFDDRYPKKLATVTKKDTSDHIHQSIYISLWFYNSGFGCKNSSKTATFRPKMRIQFYCLSMINSEDVIAGLAWQYYDYSIRGQKWVLYVGCR